MPAVWWQTQLLVVDGDGGILAIVSRFTLAVAEAFGLDSSVDEVPTVPPTLDPPRMLEPAAATKPPRDFFPDPRPEPTYCNCSTN